MHLIFFNSKIWLQNRLPADKARITRASIDAAKRTLNAVSLLIYKLFENEPAWDWEISSLLLTGETLKDYVRILIGTGAVN
jgi:hypothetical protein